MLSESGQAKEIIISDLTGENFKSTSETSQNRFDSGLVSFEAKKAQFIYSGPTINNSFSPRAEEEKMPKMVTPSLMPK